MLSLGRTTNLMHYTKDIPGVVTFFPWGPPADLIGSSSLAGVIASTGFAPRVLRVLTGVAMNFVWAAE
jgi:hypothetical protein